MKRIAVWRLVRGDHQGWRWWVSEATLSQEHTTTCWLVSSDSFILWLLDQWTIPFFFPLLLLPYFVLFLPFEFFLVYLNILRANLLCKYIITLIWSWQLGQNWHYCVNNSFPIKQLLFCCHIYSLLTFKPLENLSNLDLYYLLTLGKCRDLLEEINTKTCKGQ